jgi:PAS domain S-box-containing protein
MDLDLVFTYVNPAIRRQTGYSPEEWIGTHLSEHCDKENLTKMFHIIADETAKGPKGSGVVFEAVLLNKNREPIPLEIHGKVICDEKGEPTALQGTVRDITDRRRAEEERRNLQEQLFRSQKLEAIGTLTAGIAHDFNNLLTTIMGNAEMALMDLDNEEPLYDVLVEINETGKRATLLTRQLLAFSRKQIFQLEIFNLNKVVRDMDKILRRLITEDIEMKTILGPDLGTVEADVGQVEQILMNLVVNARDAMPRGGKLTIETVNVELDEIYAADHVAVTPGAYVMLAVSDTGVGMTDEVKAHIFEPFFTTKEIEKGTGLGLSTVYGIVKQSNGNIWVYSEPGHGATFKIYLPRVEKPSHIMEETKKRDYTPHGSETVIVVEDDESLRRMAVKSLESYGYTTLSAENGQEALSMCEKHKDQIHLMLTDVVMPGMSGKTLSDRLKALNPDINVLFMSGYTDNAIMHNEVLEKGIAFLQKPFTPDRLARKVREVLDESRKVGDLN